MDRSEMKKVPPYISSADVAKVFGWNNRRMMRWLKKADVLVVPAGRERKMVSTTMLRVTLPSVYEAVFESLQIK